MSAAAVPSANASPAAHGAAEWRTSDERAR